MTENNELTQVADDLVVTLDYTLTIDEQIIDSSKENGPIRFLQGSGEIIPGLERQLNKVVLGADQKIIVLPEEGYGKFEEARLVDFSRDELPEDVPLELGIQLKMKNQNGKLLHARIHEITDDLVKLNFNHPLAGKELHFDVTVVELRAATADELEHGRVD